MESTYSQSRVVGQAEPNPLMMAHKEKQELLAKEMERLREADILKQKLAAEQAEK